MKDKRVTKDGQEALATYIMGQVRKVTAEEATQGQIALLHAAARLASRGSIFVKARGR